ncbi:MAG: HypC/HybG/HupF family hydrogenase formation chaperone [Anaerolineaceae bacterium]|nr:HypC/HybG/HupF family hydrogenase formation chaperone [Anaerolineaceae bacterium]
MCLAVPGKISSISNLSGIRMGMIDFGGISHEVCLEAVPEANVGDYVIVHAGFALNRLSEEEARESLEAFRQLDQIEQELLSDQPGVAE